MGSSADSLTPGPLHINGEVDVGSGDGSCGACHGERDDPWPRDVLHRKHQGSALSEDMTCDTCHVVPTQLSSTGHLDGQVTLRFSGRALGQQPAAFDPVSKGCSQVACHGGPLQLAREVRWLPQEVGLRGCASCHDVPPPAPHVQLAGCGGALCHGAEVRETVPEYSITPSGRYLHIDGLIQAGLR